MKGFGALIFGLLLDGGEHDLCRDLHFWLDIPQG